MRLRSAPATLAAIAAATHLAVPSTVLAAPVAMDALELARGSDRVERGRVASVESRWNADGTGLETTTVLVTDDGRTVPIATPGGQLDGATHRIVGMPRFAVGDRVKVHLRALGDGRYRVYGWESGVQWLSPRPRFATNGMQWEPGQIPVEFVVNNAGSDDLAIADSRAAILAAFATWEDIPCSALSFSDGGGTDLGVAVDGVNVITFIESDWIYGEEAAGAASLFFAPGQTPTADVALNGQHYDWAVGVPSVGPATQDVQGVMTHELGHFAGLGHTQSSIDTMYFSWTPWQGQRSLSADDKRGLCTLYPQAGDECDTAADCDGNAPCEDFDVGRLCAPVADPIGASCDRDRIECESFCLFTNTQLSSGYCSAFCDEAPCPAGFDCNDANAGGEPVRVCFRGAACSADMACPQGRHCGDDGFCTFECREHIDCPSGEGCNFEGRCAPFEDDGDDTGCGCASSGSDGAGVIALLCTLALVCRGRRRRASRHGRTRRNTRGRVIAVCRAAARYQRRRSPPAAHGRPPGDRRPRGRH